MRRRADGGAVQLDGSSWMAVKKGSGHSKVLDALLLDVGLLDLVWEPVWSAYWLVNQTDAACEDVDTLGATLS